MQATDSDLSVSSDSNAEENLHDNEKDDDSEDDSDDTSEYEESVIFQNACREFYINRKNATESFKNDILKDQDKRNYKMKKTTSIDDAMVRLRREMASLMDQDLTLMEQLLTLNETIEDIKVKRHYGSSRESFYSSCDLNSGSDWSLPASTGPFRGSSFFTGKATVAMSSTENLRDAGDGQISQVDSGYNSP
ncbi:uncharacterized protein LOC133199713 [Saccostrea echinata]|uniref:uncharacterized protein LOC133199713 n=1 Tax=Saccostrea echinata TaxID=191078 RepID=UPI002A7F2A46|nr:uncharacterized protein LOC133199713 [Saccostrea echinata]